MSEVDIKDKTHLFYALAKKHEDMNSDALYIMKHESSRDAYDYTIYVPMNELLTRDIKVKAKFREYVMNYVDNILIQRGLKASFPQRNEVDMTISLFSEQTHLDKLVDISRMDEPKYAADTKGFFISIFSGSLIFVTSQVTQSRLQLSTKFVGDPYIQIRCVTM